MSDLEGIDCCQHGQCKLKKALKRWDTLTPAERDALVAVHVMGWTYHDGDESGGGPYWDGDPEGRYVFWWCPTADRNDCAEAVRVFSGQYYPMSGVDKFQEKLLELVDIDDDEPAWFWGEMWAIEMMLLDPSDVCRAMLEALRDAD